MMPFLAFWNWLNEMCVCVCARAYIYTHGQGKCMYLWFFLLLMCIYFVNIICDYVCVGWCIFSVLFITKFMFPYYVNQNCSVWHDYLGLRTENFNLSQLVNVSFCMFNVSHYECRYAMHYVEQEKLHHRYWAHARIGWIIYKFLVLNFVQLVNNVTLVKLALALWIIYYDGLNW
jgi:hypothetical protein